MKVVSVLLVESSEEDILLTREVLVATDMDIKISVCRNEQEAHNFLADALLMNKKVLPNLMLLNADYATIGATGLLSYIKGHPALKNIPVIVFSPSCSGADINNFYENHANCLIFKSSDCEKTRGQLNLVKNFWLRVNKVSSGN